MQARYYHYDTNAAGTAFAVLTLSTIIGRVAHMLAYMPIHMLMHMSGMTTEADDVRDALNYPGGDAGYPIMKPVRIASTSLAACFTHWHRRVLVTGRAVSPRASPWHVAARACPDVHGTCLCTCLHTCLCAYRRRLALGISMCIDMSIHMHVYMSIDMCIGMCVVCIEACVDACQCIATNIQMCVGMCTKCAYI